MKIRHILIGTSLAVVLFAACKKKPNELPPPAAAEFTIEQYIDPADPSNENTYIFRNTTPGGFLSSWNFGGIDKSTRNVDTVFFAFEGTYKIKLTSSSEGGTSSIEKDLVVENRSPYAAQFTTEKLDDYHFKVTETANGTSDRSWKFENGETSTQQVDTVYFPFAGTYDITVTVTTPKGQSSVTETVTVTADDPSNPDLTDPIFTHLTGGTADPDGKTWVMVAAGKSGGVGPKETTTLDWWNQPDGFTGATWEQGMLANEFTFDIRQYQYKPKNQKVTLHWAFANAFFGMSQAQYADIQHEDPNHKQAPFIMKNANNGVGTGYTLDFTNGSYLGYFDNRYKHEIVRLDADTLYIRHLYSDDPAADPAGDAGARYFTFVPK